MEDTTNPSAFSSNEKEPSIGGDNIARLMQAKGPVVTCVVLRAAKRNQDGSVSTSGECSEENLEELVEELEIDTTPAKNEVENILGGPITFIGQYEEGEGIVLMGLRGLVTTTATEQALETMTVGQLRERCKELDINTETMLEKQELVNALKEKLPPLNPHKLQPPLQNVKVRGDILILKVAEVDDGSLDAEEQQKPEGEDENGEAEVVPPKVANMEGDDKLQEDKAKVEGDETNVESEEAAEEFFLPYTKAEYLKFAARTDIKAEPLVVMDGEIDADADENADTNEADDDNEEGEDCDDEDFIPGEDMDELTEDEEKSAMLNIVMSELLRKFRSDNGRGAASREVLEIRASVAEQIGVEVVTYDESLEAAEEAKRNENGRKRSADGNEVEPARKRVKFDENVVDPEEDDEKPTNGVVGGEKADGKSDVAIAASAPATAQQEDPGDTKVT